MAGKLERDEQLLSIGQQCADPHCLLVDFLPFKCQHCVQSFCGEHFKVEAHNCSKYDESKHNRVAPSCPLCNQPVAIPLNQDPNIRMEHHINTECSVMTGRRQTKSAPVCARGKCGKVLFAPISCKNCNRQFCPQHRFPGDHNCGSTASISTSKPASQQIADFSSKASAASSATLEAVRRKWAATPIPSTSLANPSSTKIDRRAKAERDSRRRAMEARAKKGLLTETEKQMLAAEVAEAAQRTERKDGDCVLM